MGAKETGWYVGARIFVAEEAHGARVRTYHATVVKVGRSWVTFQPDGTTAEHLRNRFDHETMWIDGRGYSTPGRVYLSEQDYLDSTVRQKEWTEFCRRLSSYNVPSHLTLADIREIAEIQGDIEALKQHAKAFREDEAVKLALASAEKSRLKAENLERQRVIQSEAIAAKNDLRVKKADLQQRKSNAALTAVLHFVAEKHPEDTETVRAIADAARGAVQ